MILLFLAIVLPWRGRLRIRQLLAKPQVTSSERLALYASTIVFQWLITALIAWRCWARGLTASQLGLGPFSGRRILLLCLVGAAMLTTIQWFSLRRLGRLGPKGPSQMLELARRMLPRSSVELLLFGALSLTAGACEEFLFRGFAISALQRLGWPLMLVVAVSAALFGFAHLYQGRHGVASAFLLGLIFGWVRIAYGSLVPVMVWHATVDIAAGVAGKSYLLERVEE